MPANFPEWIALLPPFITIVVALVTRHAIGALFVGLITGSFIASDGFVLNTISHVFNSLVSVVYSEGFDVDHLSLFGFLWILGALIHTLIASGGMEQLSHLLMKHQTTPRKTQLTVVGLGFLVFIDDYFNTLAVGTISRPLVDRAKISREKLAYFLDSTAGPVCILAPLSSWGATIIAILDGISRNEGLESDGLNLFLQSIPLNFYSIFTILMVLFVASTQFDFPSMKKTQPVQLDSTSQNKALTSFKTPLSAFISLIFMTIAGMIFSAFYYSPSNATFIEYIQAMVIGPSLFLGALSAYLVAIKPIPAAQRNISQSLIEGMKTMAPAMMILFLAWGLAGTISELKTGDFIVEQLKAAHIPMTRIPLVSFLLAGLLSFTTGTSWATFSILLPIISQMTQTQPENLPICIAAILGGSVFGDHCSPISDTSILSSTGAGCHHMSHVMTQLPYCILTAVMTVATYFCIEFFTVSPALSFLAISSFGFALLALYNHKQLAR